MEAKKTSLHWIWEVVAVLLGMFAVAMQVFAPEERAVRERIAIDTRSDSYFYNGADLYFYSDDHSTGTITMTGDTGAIESTSVEATTFTVTNWITSSTDLVLSGDLTVGDGTPDLTQDGEDGYVEGTFEVDGAARLDGAIDANSTANFAGAVTAAGGLIIDGSTFVSATSPITISGVLTNVTLLYIQN